MLDEPTLETILSDPDLPGIAQTIDTQLAKEREDRLSFREDLTPSVKAELIAGEVVMHSSARAKHLRATGNLFLLLHSHVRKHQLGEVFSEKALVCLTRNDYEPDIVFYSAKKAKGFTNETMEFPAPDFVVEVLSETTKNRDRGVKFEDYAAHGVGEYWIVDCDDQTNAKALAATLI